MQSSPRSFFWQGIGIDGVVVDGRVEHDIAAAARVMGDHFACRRGGDDPDARWALLETALASDGRRPAWTVQEVHDAAAALRRSRIVDAEWLCPDAVIVATSQAPEATVDALLELVSETSLMSSCAIHARALGKGPHTRQSTK